MRGAAVSPTAAASGLVVFLLSVSAVQGQDGWGVTFSAPEICAVKGSTVEISCTYTYPSTWSTVERTFWFTERKGGEPADLKTASEYAGRVEDRCETNTCTLRIRKLRESDSAEYRFRIETNHPLGNSGSPGVTLSVTGLTVQVERKDKLKCQSSCLPPAHRYVWYKNLKAQSGTSSTHSFLFGETDRYSCALEGHEDFPSPAVYSPKLASVSVSASAQIEKGSSVTLTCSSDANPAASYTWYKEGHHSHPSHLNEGPRLIFSSIQSSDSGQYYCRAENELGKRRSESISMDVKYPTTLPSVSVSPSAEIQEGSSVTLNCSSDANPAASYTWYKKDPHAHHSSFNEGPLLVLSSIRSSDSGQYYCRADNKLGAKTSTRIPIDVTYSPKLPSVSVSPSAEIEEGSSVTLNCSSDANPAANYTWYKEDGNQTRRPLSTGPQLVFSSIQSSDSGEYFCTAENKLGRTSTNISIDVKYAPKPPSVSVSPSAEIEAGSSVNLTCSSDANPAANYTWYKEDEDSPKASGQNFTIPDFRAEHSGSYSCGAQNKLGRSNSTFHLSIVAGSWILEDIIRTTLGVLMLIPVVLLSLWMRKKKALRSTTEAPEPEEIEMDSIPEYENDSHTAAQAGDPEEQGDMA